MEIRITCTSIAINLYMAMEVFVYKLKNEIICGEKGLGGQAKT